MGKQSGLKRVGAKGKPVPEDSAAVADRLMEGHQIDLRELAQQHTETALDTLVAAATGGEEGNKASWSTRVKAANSLLEHGHGRADTRQPEKASGGLTVIINNLTDGSMLEKVVNGVQVAREIEEARAAEIPAEATTVADTIEPR